MPLRAGKAAVSHYDTGSPYFTRRSKQSSVVKCLDREQGGNIQLKTQELTLKGGSQISTTAVNPTLSATAGNINIDADKRSSS